MCRWLAYSGSPILLEKALYSPAHSLIDQSLHSRLGAEATNGDGFGIGWYDDAPTPGVFRSIEPAWNDQNLRELSAHVTSGHFFAHIRAAIGSAVQQTNCHPFRHGRWLFMHNGFIADLGRVKRDLAMAVDESLYPEIAGQADTELLFYLALTLGLEDDPARRRGTRDRTRGGDRIRQGREVPVPGDDRDHRRRAHLGVSLLERGELAIAVLHQQRAHCAQALSRSAGPQRGVRHHPAHRLRADRRGAWRLERRP